ncbi:MAG: hypothetical protein JW908_02310 [Anaerolineales bacterium]|nr:hypothetical protein [Anaerolineales bacterium]
MKKIHLLVILIASLFTMAAESMRTVNLTVINKSEVDIGLMLNSLTDDDRWYYFTIPNGYPDAPQGDEPNYTERNYEIAWDVYTAVAYFMEPYDPVYGYYYCGNKMVGARLMATHNVKLVYKPCKGQGFHPGRYRILRMHREMKRMAR